MGVSENVVWDTPKLPFDRENDEYTPVDFGAHYFQISPFKLFLINTRVNYLAEKLRSISHQFLGIEPEPPADEFSNSLRISEIHRDRIQKSAEWLILKG